MEASTVYGEGLSVNGRLTFGFPYPPLSLFLAIPGHLFGDHRYSQLVAMTASGALMAFARPGRLGALAAALFLFTPRGLFVLEQSWTEPFLVFLLSATVFAACRREACVPYLFGLFVVVKQYLVFVVPLAWLIVRRPLPDRKDLGRWALKALAIGAAVSLPLALWNISAFTRDVVTLQIHQPFRLDALSYMANAVREGGSPWPASFAFIAAVLAVGLSLLRAPRTRQVLPVPSPSPTLASSPSASRRSATTTTSSWERSAARLPPSMATRRTLRSALNRAARKVDEQG